MTHGRSQSENTVAKPNDAAKKTWKKTFGEMWQSVTTSFFWANNGFCSGDVCLPPSATQSVFIQQSLENVLPSEIITAMAEAAKKGMLYAFLCTLAEEGLTEYLRSHRYKRDQIHWINQAIKALILLSLGASTVRTLVVPTSSFLLSTLCKFNKATIAQLATAGIILYDLYYNTEDFAVTGAAFGSAMLGSAVVNQAVKYGYARSYFIRHGIFHASASIKQPDSQAVLSTKFTY